MLEPKKVKYRKLQKGRRRGTAHRGSTLAFGEFGLKAVGRGWMSAREIEAARVALTRYLKRGGKVWIRIFPDKPLTKKPLETRMGKGKRSPEMWVAVVQPGRILFEMEGVDGPLAREAFRLAAHKLSIPTITVERGGLVSGSERAAGKGAGRTPAEALGTARGGRSSEAKKGHQPIGKPD